MNEENKIMKIYWHQTCLFVYSHTSNFSAILWLSPLPVTGLQIVAYAGHSGPVSKVGSLLCHTYCDTEPWFIRSHPKDRHPQWDSNPRCKDHSINFVPNYNMKLYVHAYILLYYIRHCHFRMWCKDWCDSLQSTVQYCWHIWYRTVHQCCDLECGLQWIPWHYI